METLGEIFREYMTIGGMPAVVNSFINNGNYSGTLMMQRQLLLDYEEDITKYAQGLDKGKSRIYTTISRYFSDKTTRNSRSARLHMEQETGNTLVPWNGCVMPAS